MSSKQNLEVNERFGQEVANGGKLEVVDEVMAPDVVDHDPAPDQGPGAEGFKTFWGAMHTAFPDFAVEPDLTFATDEYVVMHYTATGTHQGPFQGLDPTGKSVTFKGVQVAKFQDGKIVERWGSSDELTLMKQLGVVST